MNDFACVRIDDRLIHGQIIVSWVTALGITEIIVADTDAANDEFQGMLLEMGVPKAMKFELLTLEEAGNLINSNRDFSKTLLIVRDIHSLKTLMDLGVSFSTVNYGNSGRTDSRTRYYKSVWLTEDERKLVESVMDAGITLEVRVIPSEKAIDMRTLLK